jgi:hypothetical protein
VRRTLVSLTLLAALVVSGCGGDSDRSTEEPAAKEAAGGAEASIEGFGEEAGGNERSALLAAFEGYLRAIEEEDGPAACSHLSATVRRSLEQIAAESLPGKGCAAILPRLLAPTAPRVAREQRTGEVTKVRIEGDRGFVVFRAPGARLYQLPMAKEGGRWKAANATAGVLVP